MRHPILGIDGITILGCQPLTDVVTTGANSNLFSSGTLATAAANSIGLSPDFLNGPLAAQANLHSQYVFRDLLFEYVSNVATTQAGSMALAVIPDGSTVNPPTSFSEVRQISPSVSFPFRTDRAYLHYHYDGMQTWFTEGDGASTAGLRLTVQAGLCGYPSASSIGAVSQGYINVWYIIELYSPVNSQGFTLPLRDMEEVELVRRFLRETRSKRRCLTDATEELKPVPRKQFFQG